MADSRSAEGHEASTQESQNTVATSAGESVGTSSPSLEGFWLLPEETKLLIFTLACSSPDAKGTSPDVATGRSLALTARCIHHLANSCLWSAIRITRISVLTSLAKAIAARPELGRRIKSLDAGPEDELDQLHYPYRQEGEGRNIQGRYHAPASFICTSLRSAEETQLLPSWCSPGQEWPLTPYVDEAPIFRCKRVKAVAQAVHSAQRGLGIRGGQVHLVEDDYLLQTALDLYLMNIRRIEDASHIASGEDQRCQDKTRPDYPPLLLTGTRSQPDVAVQASAPGHFVLTRKQLLDHLARPGCPSDRFDHPLLLTRVGFWASLIQEWTKGYSRWQPNNRYKPGREYDGYQYGGTEVVTNFSRPDRELMKLLRSIIERAPSLRNLSLTGLFEGAVGGERGPSPRGLRTLSLGPPPRIRHWSHVSLEFGGLENIEALHLCGVMPRHGDIPKLATLQRLKTLRWTHTDAFVEQEIIFFGVFLDALIGRKGAAAGAAAERAKEVTLWRSEAEGLQAVARLRARLSSAAPQKLSPQVAGDDRAVGSAQPLIEVRLRPDQLAVMLDRAAGEEERTAWATGRAFEGQSRRLLLTQIPSVSLEVRRKQDNVMTHALYEEGKKWWQEHCA